ncbi:hypothetical protein PEC18_11725 [Paucibacter sp. O1-1]|nr:hypothetical protein [Paucibacter sp. O1-1]MDA3826492.1 hypothetical protein [Paucibacter sp. O1-1]
MNGRQGKVKSSAPSVRDPLKALRDLNDAEIADKFTPFMSGDYFLDPANVLSVLSGRLAVAREWLDEATGMERPGEQLARVSAELQFLVEIANKGSDLARRLASLSPAERERARGLLRLQSARLDSAGGSRAEGN